MIGEKVVHPKYGHGVVRKTRHRGFELQVEFENSLTLWIRQDELIVSTSSMPFKVGDRVKHPDFGEGIVTSIEPYVYNNENTFKVSVHFIDIGFKTLIGSIAKLEKVEREKRKVKSYKEDPKFKSRRMIEAFRLGIVPYDCVEEFTFGRDKELKKIVKWLNDPNESTMFIIGEYGTGKTHLLHYAVGRALYNDFAVAWVEMDPNEAPFHKPKRVYSRLIQNFKYRSKQDGQLKEFRSFLKESLAKGAFGDHLYFKHLIENKDEIFWEWIEGKQTVPRPVEETCWEYIENKYKFVPGLYDYSTAANIYCYLVSGLGWAARKILGLNGLLLVFDEAETVGMYYYKYQFEKGLNFLEALIRTGKSEQKLLETPSKSGNKIGLSYCEKSKASEKTPFLYKIPSGLKLLFAFTIPTVEKDKTTHSTIYLFPLTDDALKQVFEHICLLYDDAYGFLVEDMHANEIFQRVTSEAGRTRLFVKGSVEALDLARLNKR
jgi:hypothetical protein